MNSFSFYLQFGFTHILDLAGYDHMLFLLALCAIYRFAQWKKVLIMVTAFTIGHSLTLALAALDIIQLPGALIEFLIAFTIFLTAIYNLYFSPEEVGNKNPRPTYLMALGFGLIHGMGFSNQFKALIGTEESIVPILFPFNLGIELGQIMFVGIILLNAHVLMDKLGLAFKTWKFGLSLLAANIAIYLMLTRVWG
ncbi:MAG: HupE/UreJ family protein [Bacteroidota bacterium]